MADYDRTGHGLEVHWAEQGRAGEDLVGPGRSHIGLPTEPREPRQAQAQGLGKEIFTGWAIGNITNVKCSRFHVLQGLHILLDTGHWVGNSPPS